MTPYKPQPSEPVSWKMDIPLLRTSWAAMFGGRETYSDRLQSLMDNFRRPTDCSITFELANGQRVRIRRKP